MSKALRIAGLCKSYQSGDQVLEVLRDLSLEVEKGTLVAITGESGSGKSTLLHLIGGMEKPSVGEIVFGNTDIVELQGEKLAEFRNSMVGFVFQFHHLLPEFTALENVMFPLLIRGLSSGEAAERAAGLLDEVGLSERSHHQPGELSGGEQQRVAIARALVGNPGLLLGDEPTGNLDGKTSDSIHRLLLQIHEEYGLTSIIVTHNPRLADLCDQQLLLVDGKLE
ncbi:MAG TPA: ABC transporter ATP-binding protein [Acidobacteriota bacterium]|nr:ABC transporter ATP-binding protein [Acidobacteriota bacterium]